MFITFEGGEGAGKSTQAKLLADALRATGRSVLLTREPGGSPGAETLRELILAGAQDWSPLAETLLHFAARADHVDHTINPALKAGACVISDRFYDSTMAYQGYGQGEAQAVITALIELLGVRPNLTLMLMPSAAVAAARMVKRHGSLDRYERLGPAFHARVEAGFRAIAAAEPDRCVLVDSDPSKLDVHAQIRAVVTERLGL